MPAFIFKVSLKPCGCWGHQVTKEGCRLQQKAIPKTLLNQQTAADFWAGFAQEVACLFHPEAQQHFFNTFL